MNTSPRLSAVSDRPVPDLRGEQQVNEVAPELTDVVLSAEPGHVLANEVQAEACAALRRTSANEKGFYRSGELLARRRLATVTT